MGPDIRADLREHARRKRKPKTPHERELAPVGRIHIGHTTTKNGKRRNAFVYKRPENEKGRGRDREGEVVSGGERVYEPEGVAPLPENVRRPHVHGGGGCHEGSGGRDEEVEVHEGGRGSHHGGDEHEHPDGFDERTHAGSDVGSREGSEPRGPHHGKFNLEYLLPIRGSRRSGKRSFGSALLPFPC